MSYQKGDLQQTPLGFHVWEADMDSRDDNRYTVDGEAYLPHSCSAWIIGGRENIEALIADLQAVLTKDLK